MTIPVLPGLATLAAKYDGFILDLWGVIHDGTAPYPGAVDALQHLKDLGKKTVLLTNAPRRGGAVIELMNNLGIPRHLYGGVMSSGEAVHIEMRDRADPAFKALGTRLYHLGPERDRNIFDQMPDYQEVDSVEEADFVLNTGPVSFDETLADYEDVLAAAAARRLPMVCANPDLIVMRKGERVMCAGALAVHYRELGCQVLERGKPDPAIYDACLEELGIKDRSLVLAVGDALHTDIKGASQANIAAVMVASGIHAEELGIAWGEMPEASRAEALALHHGQHPIAVIPAFVW
jgi:HAD superfamily hydrolase (TIGR01459 family)